MAEDFLKNLVKEYKYWEIYVHENQGYLGRCVVWCKREDALDLADATPEEQAELFLVLRDLREAAKKVFQPDWFNYSFLGNETRHLHGHNYKTNHDFKTSPELLLAVRDKYREVLK